MSNWSQGYNVDVGYTKSFFPELAPSWLSYGATLQGFASPSENGRFLELGCGFGFGLTLLAAAHPEQEFLGVDFNPVHIAHARKLAHDAKLGNIRFEEADFVDLGQDWPADWGKFDYVVAHGVYTWVAPIVRAALVQILSTVTQPGALVYLSYNCQPGWNQEVPAQYLMRMWQRSENLESKDAVQIAVSKLRALRDADSGMTRATPGIEAFIQRLERQDRANQIIYQIHEYLNDYWRPIWFDQLIEEVSAAKLAYIGSADLGEAYLQKALPQEQRSLLAGYRDPIIREVMLDVLVNRRFRKDIFARGKIPLPPSAQRELILNKTFVQLKETIEPDIRFQLPVGHVQGNSELCHTLFNALGSGSKTLQELAATTQAGGALTAELVQSMTLMMHAGMVGLQSPVTDVEPAKRLNRLVANEVCQGTPHHHLIAPAIGNILNVQEIEIMLLHECLISPDPVSPEKLSARLLSRLKVLGKSLLNEEGTPISNPTEKQSRALDIARTFLASTLVRWKRLEIV